MPKQLFIRKASGNLVPFDEQKVKDSLRRAMVDEKTIKKILKETIPNIKSGMSSKELYADIYKLLHKTNYAAAAKYNLKQAIMQLGPSGYPFEQFLSGVLRRIGYQTWTNQIVRGKCVTHEIDIIAERNEVHYMVEAKYHNIPGKKSTIQDTLYTYARFLDVNAGWEKKEGEVHPLHRPWLITNTKISSEAIDYANCIGIELSSWDYPLGTSLRKLITSSGTHPITSIQSLTEVQLEWLLANNKVLAMDILDMDEKHIEELKLETAYDEAQQICLTDSSELYEEENNS